MIIEFFGISGVGKSTIAKKIFSEKQSENKKVKWYRYELYENHSWLSRNIIKGISIIFYSITHLKWTKKLISFAKKMEIDSKSNFINIIFNSIHLKYMQSKCTDNNAIYIFDEGVLQDMWAMYQRTQKKINSNDINNFLSLYRLPDQVIVVDAKSEVIKERLMNRNRKTKIMENDNLLEEIENRKKILDTIVTNIKKQNDVEINIYDNN